jgi:hypothetical protein
VFQDEASVRGQHVSTEEGGEGTRSLARLDEVIRRVGKDEVEGAAAAYGGECTLASMAWSAGRADSTRVACAAPRDNASNARAPVPAYRSRTVAPAKARSEPRIAKTASRTRSDVGRVALPRGASSVRERCSPPVMRIGRLVHCPRRR